MSSNPNISSQPSFNLGSLIARYRRYWWLFVLSAVACLSLAVLYLKVKKPVYQIQASVLINDNDAGMPTSASKNNAFLKSLSFGSGGGVEDEIVVMGSQQLRMEMVKRLRLNRTYIERVSLLKRVDHYGDSPIEVDAPETLFDTLSTAFTIKMKVDRTGRATLTAKEGRFKQLAHAENVKLPATLKTPYGLFNIRPTDHYRAGKEYNITAVVSGNVPYAEGLAETLTVGLLRKKANAIDINVEETNVARGRDMLATLIELYNRRGLQEKDQRAMNTAQFIDDRLQLVYKDLMGSEAEIEAYKRAHNMIDPELQTKSLIGRQDVADRAMVNLEARYRIVSMIKDYVNNPANRNTFIPFSADSTAASGAISAYNELIMRRMRLEASAIGDNPQLQALDQQIETMRQGVISGVDNSLRALRVQINQAGAVSATSSSKMSTFPTTEREVRSLYRQQGIQNEIYTFLLQKREENALLLAANTPRGTVVDQPYARSRPLRPNKSLVFFLALCGTLLIPIALLALKRMLTTRFSTQDELEALTSLPVIGTIAHNNRETTLIVTQGDTSANAERFRSLRNNVQFMLPTAADTAGQVVLVTSCVSGEGKTFVSVNLAAAFALTGRRVALVGLDIRNPQLADALSLNELPGATSFLSQTGVTLDQITQPLHGFDCLDVIVGGAIPPNPSELLLSDRMRQLVDQLRANHDIIIIDSAPVGQVTDTFALTDHAHMTLAVTRAGYTRRDNIALLNRFASDGRINNVGIAVNDLKNANESTYGYAAHDPS